jgi:hypothetical protein
MEKLTPDFRFETSALEDKLRKIASELSERDFDREVFREKLSSAGYEVRRLAPKSPSRLSFLSVDSSTVKKELRYHALWGIHTVAVYSEFDGRRHPDPLAQGDVGYMSLMYDSYMDVGAFWPYRQVDSRADSQRVAEEYSAILKSLSGLSSAGKKPDLLLIDGSLQTTARKLRSESARSKFKEHHRALELQKRLLSSGKVVGMVEDSHSTDVSRKLGLEATNIAVLWLLLGDNEYVSYQKDDIFVCHLKLPQKRLSYTHSRLGDPLVVRWEFSYEDFESDLAHLAAVWMREDDIWHPQIYPIRVADYLTRKVKIGGVLDSLIEAAALEPKYREMREG